jgi:ABC-type spermidine/putrescine transport system permease subunit I
MSIPAPVELATPPRRRKRGTAKVNLGLLSVPVLWLGLFFLIPVVLVGLYSVGALTLISYDQYLSLQPWRDFLHSSIYLGSPLGRGLFWKSMKMSLGVSITCVLLAYPSPTCWRSSQAAGSTRCCSSSSRRSSRPTSCACSRGGCC